MGRVERLQELNDLPAEMDPTLQLDVQRIHHLLQLTNSTNEAFLYWLNQRRETLFQLPPNVQQLAQALPFQLHLLQIFSLVYFITYRDRFTFLHLGIGNGKTLVSVVLAVALALKERCPVILLTKLGHLVYGAHHDYQNFIIDQGLQTNTNQLSQRPGVYFFSETELTKLLEHSEPPLQTSVPYLVVDEYDSVIFDGSKF